MAVIGGVAMEGGRGRIVNTMFGAFIFGMISNILTLLGLPTKLVNAVKGAIIILAVLIQRKDKDR
jgi:ribose transport system permease protein